MQPTSIFRPEGSRRKIQVAPFAAGLLLAGACFALAFGFFAHQIALFESLLDSWWANVLMDLCIFYLSIDGLRLWLRDRAKRKPSHC